ncbi:MAG: hypothetical protein ABIK89_09655 [Planctomycetota bacterium]
MRGNKLRLVAIGVLAVYVLALTVGVGFHVHGDHGYTRQTAACSGAAAHPPADCQGEHSCDLARRLTHCDQARGNTSPRCHVAERCLVCQFLAQKPVPAQPAVGVTCRASDQKWEPVHPVHGAGNVPSAHHIRGPPALA